MEERIIRLFEWGADICFFRAHCLQPPYPPEVSMASTLGERKLNLTTADPRHTHSTTLTLDLKPPPPSTTDFPI